MPAAVDAAHGYVVGVRGRGAGAYGDDPVALDDDVPSRELGVSDIHGRDRRVLDHEPFRHGRHCVTSRLGPAGNCGARPH